MKRLIWWRRLDFVKNWLIWLTREMLMPRLSPFRRNPTLYFRIFSYLDFIFVPVRVTRCALAAHWYTYAPTRCRTSLYCRTFFSLSVSQALERSCWTRPYSMVWDWRVSRAGPMLFYWLKLLYPYYSILLFFLSLLSVFRLVLWGWGLRTDRVYITLSQPCTANIF